MLERLLRAFLVVGSVSVACAWTWPGAFPAADPRRPVGRRVARGHLCAPRQPAHIRDEAERVLHTRPNILVSGGTASGNTTLLNALIALIPDDQRIVAIEDTLELPIDSPNRVRFEARRLQQGALTIRDLVRHALRHRPDHIVVGVVRGTEAADLLQALNTGIGGSPATPPPRRATAAAGPRRPTAPGGAGPAVGEQALEGS